MSFLKNIWKFRPLTDGIDVIDNTDCPAQTESYNTAYKNWRTRTDNRYAFHGRWQKNVYSFVDGVGMETYHPVNEQRCAWRQLCSLLLAVILLYLFADVVLPIISILLLKLMGVGINYSFHERIPYGSQYAVLSVLVTSHVLRYVLPIWYAGRRLQMPKAVGYPLRIGERWNSCFAICGVLMLFVCTDVGLVLTNQVSGVVNAEFYYIMNHMDDRCYHIYLLVEMLIVPVLAEMLLRGALFQASRQFGVWFAILLMALMEFVMTRNPLAAVIILPTGLFTGFAVWISGSMVTGIIIHVLYRVMRYLTFLSPELPELMGMSAKWYLLLFAGIIGAIGCILLLLRRRFQVQDYRTFLSVRDTMGLLANNAVIVSVWVIGLLTMSAHMMI